MSNYGMKEVFDLAFFDYEDGQMLFRIDSSCGFEIKRKHGRTMLVIEDALINMDIANKFLTGDWDNVEFKIYGNSKIRNAESGMDEDVQLVVNCAEFYSYGFSVNVMKATLQFDVLAVDDEIFKLIGVKK